ncbi:MAG: tetratricopeptide repeat protein [Anaerolineae bacterium]|nr:tetratricopeptide repeat protein [Anaerolineae bacterium]
MRFGLLTARLLRGFRSWERPSQIAFLLALPFLIITFVLMLTGGPEVRPPATFGFIGFVVVTQFIFMWANRKMVTPYTQAQRLYLREEFEAARQLLEQTVRDGKATVSILTLLGNTYRQLGLLDESKAILTKAVEKAPKDHFSLYGIGRTLLIRGEYVVAIRALQDSIEQGAPPIVRLDLAEAYYREGQWELALAQAQAALPSASEPHRLLLVRYLLHRLGSGEPPLVDLVEAGLPYWMEQAGRYATSPYGQALSADVEVLKRLLEGSDVHDF